MLDKRIRAVGREVRAMAQEIFDVVIELRARREPFEVATVIETAGSASAKTGAKAVIGHDGRVVAGWVGGGCAESTACHTALECMRSGETRVIDIDLNDEVLGAGMPCGGSMRVYVEPVLPKPALWIMGHGRVAECLCLLADLMGLVVVVNDPMADRVRYPAAGRLISDDMDYSQLNPQAGDYVVIATQHKGDHESMKRALGSQAGYIALIASCKRARLVVDYLRDEGYDKNALARVMAPAGIDLGARAPEEIALSVISEIVMTSRSGSGVRMRDRAAREPGPARAVGSRRRARPGVDVVLARCGDVTSQAVWLDAHVLVVRRVYRVGIRTLPMRHRRIGRLDSAILNCPTSAFKFLARSSSCSVACADSCAPFEFCWTTTLI